MRSNDIVGYIADALVWCPPCAAKVYVPRIFLDDPKMSCMGHDKQEILPMHAGTEYDTQPVCAQCNHDIPVMVLPKCKGCGLYHTGSKHPRMSMHMPAEARELARG